jgi:hypothetical protein
MSAVDQLRRGLRHPEKVIAKGRQRIGKLQNRLQGCDFMQEDWDNLLILDACRYDMFERLNDVPGTLQSRRSNGSATREFVRNTFVGETYHDTVYVTANPFVSMDAGDAFHATIDLWRTDWNERLGTVEPEVVTEAVLEAADRYPDKRLVGHFIQPHHPFIGPTGRAEISESAGNAAARWRALNDGERPDEAPDTVWSLARRGEISTETLKRAYDENLELALASVQTLVDELDGQTVVTSDHGNLIDEPAYGVLSAGSSRFAHPKHATASALVRVPWLVCEAAGRRDVRSDPPEERTAVDDSMVEERLEALGYA